MRPTRQKGCSPVPVAPAPAGSNAAGSCPEGLNPETAVTPPAPAVQKITLASKALFDFDKAVLPARKVAVLIVNVASRKCKKLELRAGDGSHRPSRPAAIQPEASERVLQPLRPTWPAKGVAMTKIETLGMGKTQPVPGVVCDQKNRKQLIACLQPHRRVEVEVKGRNRRSQITTHR